MKKVLFSFILACFGSALMAQYPTNGLVVYYPFNGTTADASGNGYNATSSNITYGTGKDGTANSAVVFNGTTSQILYNYAANEAAFELQNYSVAFWVYTTTTPSLYANIVEFDLNSFIRFYVNPSEMLQCGYFENGGSYPGFTTAGTTFSGTWKHYAFTSTYNSSSGFREIKWYEDGVFRAVANATPTTIAYGTGNTMYIGHRNAVTNMTLNGKLQDFFYYNRELTKEEVAQIYGGCITPSITTATSTSLSAYSLSTASYRWLDCDNGNVPVAGATSNTFSPTFSGNYAAEMTINNCVDTSICMYICAIPAITISQDSLTVNVPNASYQWLDCNNGDSLITDATAQSFVPTVSGSYSVIVTTASCTEVSNCAGILLSGLDKTANSSSFNVFPNPADNNLTVSNLAVGATLRMIDLNGHVLITEIVNNPTLNLDISSLPNAMYFIQIENEGVINTRKIVVTK